MPSQRQWAKTGSLQMTAAAPKTLKPADPSMQSGVSSPKNVNRTVSAAQPPSQEVFTFSATLPSNSLPPPPGARAPMIRRASRFDPMETTPEEDGYDPTPRHPLRRIREDPQPPLPPERQERSDSVSLPGIKALLNAADQPPLVSPFGGSFFSPSVKSAQSSTSPLDSPTSRTSRFSSLTSSAADSQGWWAPDERGSVAGFSRTSSFNIGREGEPDFKRRRSDLAPIPPDADETARLKWQAQSRNASFPSPTSGAVAAGSGGGGLRSMLYPPPAPSSHLGRGSIGSNSLASPTDSPFDYHASSRSSPMSGPLVRSFADLAASDRSPPSEASTPLRARSPTDRRPSMFPRPSLSSESVQQVGSRETPPASSASAHPTAEPGQRLSLTRPPSPEPTAQAPRRSSLAELIMAKSGDNVTLGRVGARQWHSMSSDPYPNDLNVPYIGRRESTESIMSTVSASFVNHLTSSDPEPMPPARDRRTALVAPPLPPPGGRRPSFGPVSEDEPESKGDPGMRGMEVLAESARRVADAERKNSMEDDQPAGGGPAKPTASGSTGPKYPCQYCKKAFTRPSSLRIHTYSHTGERPYVCSDPTCRRRFSVQSNLKRHAKVHHQNNQQAQSAAAAQMGTHHSRQPPPPGPHQMHMGRGPQPGMYGYPGHPHPGHGPPMPPHPHMVHPSVVGYGPPPPGYMPGPGHPVHPGPPPGHFRGPMRPNDHGPPGGPYHVDQRRLSGHDMGPQGPVRGPPPPPHGGGDGDWETEEEEDELDEDD